MPAALPDGTGVFLQASGGGGLVVEGDATLSIVRPDGTEATLPLGTGAAAPLEVTHLLLPGVNLVRIVAKQTGGSYGFSGAEITLFEEIPTTSPEVGDVTGDGLINVADVTALANLIAAGNAPPVEIGDINGDGIVNEADVQALAEWIVLGSSTGPGEITIMLPGDVPLVMTRIPAGSFSMGSPSGERGRLTDEGPQTNVTISRDFYMGKYEVTQAQWQAVMGNNPSGFQGANRPVETVSWDDAQGFIAALNAHIAATGQGLATMRLPTEAEWEYAARAGSTTRFHFGDSLSVGDDCEDDGIRGVYMWYCGNSAAGQTQPVGTKLPNAFGLHDMYGNVWEWCQDWYDSSLPGGSVLDPAGPPLGVYRVKRGGGWSNTAWNCRSANRPFRAPSDRYDYMGFRVASDR